MTTPYRSWAIVLALLLLNACSAPAHIKSQQQSMGIPKSWSNSVQQQFSEVLVEDYWIKELNDNQVEEFIKLALNNNQQIIQKSLSVDIREQQLISTGAQLWPSLDFSMRRNRARSVSVSNAVDTASASLNVQYELDIWGKLSAAERNSNHLWLSEQASFEQDRQQLALDVVQSWLDVIEAGQLLSLFQKRVNNAKQNLDIIESSYRRGLKNALDVYLARNELNSQASRLSDQKTQKTKTIRKLERLIGQYPEGKLTVTGTIPVLEDNIPLGLPSELVTRVPSLVASWNRLLASDAALAFAHKQRFPSINLTASVGDSGSNLTDLLSGSPFSWSLIGNLTTPIFNAGRLKANQKKAMLELQQTEQAYLDSLYTTFQSVENGISQERSLKDRHMTMLSAQENAILAAHLSFEQYQKGLVEYTTVLDSQNRSFDAQTTVIQLKKQLITNRMALHVALGGEFKASQPKEKK